MGVGTSAITASRTGRDGTGAARTRGASTRTDRIVIGSVDGHLNTAIEGGRGVEVVSDARVGTTPVRTAMRVPCTTTLSHQPVFERRGRARVLDRASLNRNDMCRTDLKR